MKKRIGLFLDALPHTGGTFQYNLCMLEAIANLPRDRFEVVVAYTSTQWLEFLHDYDIESKFVNYHFAARVCGIVLNLLVFPLTLWHKLCPRLQKHARSLVQEKCDLWIFPSQDVVSYQVPVPSLVTILDLAHRVEKKFPESASKSEFLIRERIFTNICRQARGVLVQTELGRKQVVDAYEMPEEKIHILPLIAPDYMHRTEIPDDFDLRYHLPVKYLFYPAQFWEHKNHRNLLTAMAKLKQELPDLKLVLAGSKKNAYKDVLQLIQDLSLTADVCILGYVPNEDMPELYRRARALIMPTYFGPSNIPPLEAAVVGCPVAVSDVSSMSDQLGNAVLVFDPDSTDEITDCIRKLWTDNHLCARLAAEAKERVAAWNQTEFNDRLRRIIEKVTAQPLPSDAK